MITSAPEARPFTAHHFRLKTPCPWHLLSGPDSAFCWRDGPEGDVWFALGQAREFPGLDACREFLREHEPSSSDLAPRGFAIMAFDPSQTPQAPWRAFPVRKFVLPRALFRWRSGEATGIEFDLHSNVKSQISSFPDSSLVPHPSSLTGEHSFFPRSEWRAAVRAVQAEIARGSLQKAVLARQVTLTIDNKFDPTVVLRTLSADAENSIVFAYHQLSAGVFLGATPERLFQLRDRQLTVDSLAGTRLRGNNSTDDRRLAHELSSSAKDRIEQELVTRHLTSSLRSFCDQIKVEETPRVRKLATVQHLCTLIEARLRENTSLDGLLDALHPTPATCGLPVALAREMITELEPEPRGLYAGLIGWIGAEEAEFAVMIRSGLLQGNTARIFGGAGIVTESDPDAEFDECEWKMEPLRRALLTPVSPRVRGD